jgi:hypothetical protein
MKPAVGNANNSRAFNLHFFKINGRIQDNFTPFVHKFFEGKKFTLAACQCNCMEIDLSERTNNAGVIKYFNVQLFAFFPPSKFGSLIRGQKSIHIVIKY